jgi:hypothetical protein
METGSRARLATLALAASTGIGLACILVLSASACNPSTEEEAYG